MESLFLNLIRILKQQDKTLAELLNTAEEHNQALRQNDTVTVLSTAYKQDELSKKLKSQDRKLEEAKKQLTGVCGITGKAVLSDFTHYAPESLTAELAEISQNLKEKILRLGEINSLNKVLSRRGQIFTEKLIRIMTPCSGNTYMGSGRLTKEGKPLRIFDATI
jgi:flagellar biosynthesis/type III secretory pathway chaperone